MNTKSIITTHAVALLASACTSTTKEEATTVHLKGHITDLGEEFITMRYEEAPSLLGDTRDITLAINAEGYIDTVLQISEPTYYSIGRNTLYLTPGDDLSFKINSNNEEAVFEGKGAEANNYLKQRLFPTAGSFLDAGTNVRSDFQSTKALIDSLATVRKAELDATPNVSDKFKDLEHARIKADIVNSCAMYPAYSDMFTNAKRIEEMQQIQSDFWVSIGADVNTTIKELTDESYLDIAVVRNVLSFSSDSLLRSVWFADVMLSERTTELFEASKVVESLRDNVTKEDAAAAEAFLATMKNADFKKELEHKLALSTKLMEGKPANDFTLTDTNGQEYKLSDFKGKLIYIDLWATWCGPYLNEAPHFEALAKEYVGKEILFLPISTDSTTEPWLSYLSQHNKELQQYHSSDLALKEGWDVLEIPRFILIDKDFNIVNAYAPRPSDPAIKALLDEWLAK